MPIAPVSDDIDIYYEAAGPEDGPPVLLIMGIGQQLVAWPDAFVDGLAQAGFRVVRYDARDTGLSTHLDHVDPPPFAEMIQLRQEGRLTAPYTLEGFADDAAGLVRHFGWPSAHVVGVSMGGMVAQHLALRAPETLRSLTCIMTTTSEPDLPGPDPEALKALVVRPKSGALEDVVAHGVAARRVLGSPGYPTPDEYWAAQVARAHGRDYSPKGFGRHLLAVNATPPWADRLGEVRAPTLVLHGADDPLIRVACGERVAERIPGARLEVIEGMGHDLGPSLCPTLVARVVAHASAADTVTGAS